MHGLAVYVKEELPFVYLSLENSADSVFNWLYFSQCLTCFSFMDHLLQLCAQCLILLHLTQTMFSRSTHLLIVLSLETLTSTIRTGLPILVELIDLVNSAIIFLSKMILLKLLTLLGSQTVYMCTCLKHLC